MTRKVYRSTRRVRNLAQFQAAMSRAGLTVSGLTARHPLFVKNGGCIRFVPSKQVMVFPGEEDVAMDPLMRTAQKVVTDMHLA